MYRFVDHTGELQLEVEADSLDALFAEAAAALAEVLRGHGAGEPASRQVEVRAPDRAALLVEWLSELLYLADAEGFLAERVRSLQVGRRRLQATVEGRRGRPSPLLKAVTYHGLELRRRGHGYHARVVFDV